MEISFDSRETVVYTQFSHQSRRIQESAESVVPDTDADIEKIAAVQSAVFLKSKDLTGRGVLISGEVTASVIYIRDGQAGLSEVRIRKPFSLEFEAEGLESETLAQVALRLQGTDVRLVNPRKISVLFDVEGELSCYRSENLRVASELPEDIPGLHARMETRSLTLPNAVCEKSLALNEQFPIPTDGGVPMRLIAEKTILSISDCQLLGSKLILKGSAEVSVCTLGEESIRPTVSDFSAPFSQIIDLGAETMQYCQVRPELTGSYYELIDTINGEKALDVELHAVLQVVSFENREIRCVEDVYSNLMPAEPVCSTREYALSSAARVKKLSMEERVGLMEECRELLHVFPTITRLSTDGGKLGAALVLDFVFKNGEDRLTACRRTVALSEDTGDIQLQILRVGQLRLSIRPDGEYADCAASLDLLCLERRKEAFTAVDGVILDEEKAYVQGSLPTLTLVRRAGESLWALAKSYHSSEDKIRELNEDAENTKRMLLIPKCI